MLRNPYFLAGCVLFHPLSKIKRVTMEFIPEKM